MKSEHEGHVWMISQLPAATSGRQQSPGMLEEQKKLLGQSPPKLECHTEVGSETGKDWE